MPVSQNPVAANLFILRPAFSIIQILSGPVGHNHPTSGVTFAVSGVTATHNKTLSVLEVQCHLSDTLKVLAVIGPIKY